MKIKYYPVENLMSPDPDDRRMQIASHESVTEKEIFTYVTRPGSGITPAEAKGNYEEFIGAYEYFLKQGYGINTEFINVRPSLQGVLKNEDDKFDHARHKIRFKVTLGKRYNNTTADVKVEKVEAVSNAPLPVTFEDIASATINDTLTPGSVASLKGVRLNFKHNDPQQGVFLVAADDSETRIEKILSQKGTQVVLMIPEGLVSGEYTLEVRVLPHGNKDVKKGILPDKLSV